VERLDEYPEVFRRTDPMPWDEPDDSAGTILWPFGERAGTPLQEFSSNALVRMRNEVELKNGRGVYFKPLLDAIDAVLFEREGL